MAPFITIWKLTFSWFDGLEVSWNGRTIYPRPKPVKYSVYTAGGQIQGTFIPTNKQLISKASYRHDGMAGGY